MVRIWLDRFWRSNRGTALIESAIVLPVFLMLIGGVYEFGYFFYQQQLMTTGVRDAARYLALSANPNNATKQQEAIKLAVFGEIDGGTIARVPGWSTRDVAISMTVLDNSSGFYCAGCTVAVITVSTSLTDSSLGFLGLLGLNAPIISVLHQERWVGGSALEIYQ
jgi:Flp pilus assembly protein TadG